MSTTPQYSEIMREMADGSDIEYYGANGFWRQVAPAVIFEAFLRNDPPGWFRAKPKSIEIGGAPHPVGRVLGVGSAMPRSANSLYLAARDGGVLVGEVCVVLEAQLPLVALTAICDLLTKGGKIS